MDRNQAKNESRVQLAAAKVYQFHTDPGHGWLFVPGDALRSVGLGPIHFSRYSYLEGFSGVDGLYLEEDCDAGIFLARLRHLSGLKPIIREVVHHGDAPIRNKIHNDQGWQGHDEVTNWPAVSLGAIPELRPAHGIFSPPTFGDLCRAHGGADTPADGITHD